MRTPSCYALGFLLSFAAIGAVGAQTATPVQRIRQSASAYQNTPVRVAGKVVRHVDATSSQYYLEDDFGGQIRIVSSAARPPVDVRCDVSGTVALETTGDPYIVEQSRSGCGEPAVATDADADGVADSFDRCPGTRTGARIDGSGCERDNTLAYVGGLVVLCLIGGALVLRASRKPEPAPVIAAASPTMDAAPTSQGDDEDYFRGATIRFARPAASDGTLKLVPGRMEVVGGPDKGNELRFVHTAGGATPEVTFGRQEGPKFKHIQLTSPTVSRRHALMRFEGGSWAIANFSDTNPVTVNGDAMTEVGKPRPLQDGDLVEFGEVALKFHSR